MLGVDQNLPVDVQVSALIGFLLPLLVAVIIRSNWPGWVKGLVVIGSSAVAGALTAWAQGKFSENWSQNIGTILILAIASYKLFWQPTGIGPALERATQPAALEDPKSPATKHGV